MTDLSRPDELDLSNWRSAPASRWSFQHIAEVLDCAHIAPSPQVSHLPTNTRALGEVRVDATGEEPITLDELLVRTSTDALCVAHAGTIVHERYAPHYNPQNPHIVFSVSKSITAMLAGVLVGQGRLDPAVPVPDYVPEVRDSVYADCTVQQVLDMLVSTSFEEDYTATSGDYRRYREATGWHPVPAGETPVGLHAFLATLKKGSDPHGLRFRYRSPNADLLGWILERAGGAPFAQLLSRYLWEPMGAESAALITLDHLGAARSAGGICATARDLVRLGEIMRRRGFWNGRQIIPAEWVDDCIHSGDSRAWERGDFCLFLPGGRYRNQWYCIRDEHAAISALGIHGQWFYIDPDKALVVVKLSSQSVPVDEPLDIATLRAFEMIGENLERG